MFFIESERLKLIPLNYTQLLLLRESREAMEKALGLTPSNMVIEPFYHAELIDALDNYWLPNIQQHPQHWMWYTNWEIILKTENVSVGGIGMGYPNDNGESTTGYCIDQKQHRKGYASEALKRLCEWAFTNPEVKAICADTFAPNIASQKVLLKAGFKHMDDKDGHPFFKLAKPDGKSK